MCMSSKTYNLAFQNVIIYLKGESMIKGYRQKKGYTLEELAEKCDISWRNLQRIENGKYNVAKFETIKKIIKNLEFSDKDIINFIKK